MEQNSETWHQWRQQGLGGSDAPVVMEVSPYATPMKLWEEKIGLVKREDTGSFVTDLGHKFEPTIRADFELREGHSIDAQCAQHDKIPWLRASLDGMNEDKRVFVEIKYVGADKLKWVQDNQLPPPDHHPQLQHQFLVTGFQRAFYIAYTLTPDRKKIDDMVKIPVVPDLKYIREELFPKLDTFWHHIKTQTPPPLTDKDMKVLKTVSLVNDASAYVDLLKKQKTLEGEIDVIKKRLVEAAKHPLVQIGCVKLQRITKKGSVEYKKIPELQGVDLDSFRKKPSSYCKITKL